LFLRFWAISWAIVHSFGFLGWFTRPMRLTKCLRGMTKTLSFFTFLGRFVSYCLQFWVCGAIYKEYDNLYLFERHD
jgi:hypothetical protein